MSTAQTWQTASDSLEATLSLAAGVGARLRGGEIIELISDLGGGKTVFVKGLAQGMGSQETVRSPSFTIGNQYKAPNALTLYHFDFYRLNDAGILREQLAEVLNDPEAVTVIEWAQIVEDVLPAERLSIDIKATSDQGREFTFTHPPNLAYVIPGTIS